MKRIIGVVLLAAMLLSFGACTSEKFQDLSAADRLLRKDPALSFKDNLYKFEADPEKDDGRYLVIAGNMDGMDSTVYSFEFKNGKIEKLKEIEQLQGAILNYKAMELNGSQFWQFDIANHAGNGSSYFYSVDRGKVQYEIPATVDRHFEEACGAEYLKWLQMDLSGLKYNKDEHMYPYSVVFSGGVLNSYHGDLNGDGYDDLVFYGAALLMERQYDGNYSNIMPTQIVPIERKYYFDAKANAFSTEKP